MANGRSPGRRSGTGGFSGSGRSRGGKANRVAVMVKTTLKEV